MTVAEETGEADEVEVSIVAPRLVRSGAVANVGVATDDAVGADEDEIKFRVADAARSTSMRESGRP